LQFQSDAELSGLGGTGTVKSHLAFAKSVKIGSLEFHNCPVEVYDRKPMHAINGVVVDENVDGLIGMDLLKQFLITLDYPHGELNVAPLPPLPNVAAASLSMSDTAEQWHDRYVAPEMSTYALAYRMGHDLVVPTRVANDKNGDIRLFILDTGAYNTMLTTDAARSIRKLQRDQADQVFGLAGAETNLYSVGRVHLEFAHVGLVADGVLAIDSSELGNTPMRISGMIGASALRQCVLHLDYRDGLVKLEYTPGPSRFFAVQ
jgi:predicted aspartyl protease